MDPNETNHATRRPAKGGGQLMLGFGGLHQRQRLPEPNRGRCITLLGRMMLGAIKEKHEHQKQNPHERQDHRGAPQQVHLHLHSAVRLTLSRDPATAGLQPPARRRVQWRGRLSDPNQLNLTPDACGLMEQVLESIPRLRFCEGSPKNTKSQVLWLYSRFG